MDRTLESVATLISSTDRFVKTANKSVEFRNECDATTTTIYMTTDKPPAWGERHSYDYKHLLCDTYLHRKEGLGIVNWDGPLQSLIS